MNITEEQIKEFLEMFDNIPNYEHEPIKFKYMWNLYLHMESRDDEVPVKSELKEQ